MRTRLPSIPKMPSELILGGQKSGKSRWAEDRARGWLAQADSHRVVMVATAQPLDDEMRERITRHQADRALRLPGVLTVEEPVHLAQAITAHSNPHTMVVVDCLTLWLTNLLMPAAGQTVQIPVDTPDDQFSHQNMPNASTEYAQAAMLLVAIRESLGPVVLVSNEIGFGVVPMGREVRKFVDALGQLNQSVAKACDRVTLMAAGLPLCLKGSP